MKKPTPPHKRKPSKSMDKSTLRTSKKGKNTRALSTSEAPENSSNPKILQIVEARKQHQKEKGAHRKFIWNLIGDACTFGRELMGDEEAWLQFCGLDWGKLKGPKVNQCAHAIRFAMKFIFARGKKGEKRASFYYSAVRGLIEDGLEGKALAKAIASAGGLKRLQSQKSANNKPREQLEGLRYGSAISDTVRDSPGDDHDTNEDGDDDDYAESLYRARVDEGEESDDDAGGTVPKHVDPSVEMLFSIFFPMTPFRLIGAKLPANVVIKGEMVSFGKSSVFKVRRYKVKKPKA